jgi:hypothetical protein
MELKVFLAELVSSLTLLNFVASMELQTEAFTVKERVYLRASGFLEVYFNERILNHRTTSRRRNRTTFLDPGEPVAFFYCPTVFPKRGKGDKGVRRKGCIASDNTASGQFLQLFVLSTCLSRPWQHSHVLTMAMSTKTAVSHQPMLCLPFSIFLGPPLHPWMPASRPRPETFPPLAFETVTVAGQINTLGQPILIPALDMEGSKVVGGNEDVTLTMKNVPGLVLTVFANSVTCADGARQC